MLWFLICAWEYDITYSSSRRRSLTFNGVVFTFVFFFFKYHFLASSHRRVAREEEVGGVVSGTQNNRYDIIVKYDVHVDLRVAII